jgi:prepilin-type N-terminal cleavage/methylation domain-containing protein
MKKGFTLIELLVVVAIIGILSTIVLSSLSSARTRAHTSRTLAELRSLSLAFELYHLDNNDYPNDVTPNIMPNGMDSYLPNGWPLPSFPNAVYDWEYWDSGTASEAIQISVRFCENGSCSFPNEPWAEDFINNQNAAFWCISGQCRPWEEDLSGSVNGHCFNCS